jgi:hypothetical protein
MVVQPITLIEWYMNFYQHVYQDQEEVDEEGTSDEEETDDEGGYTMSKQSEQEEGAKILLKEEEGGTTTKTIGKRLVREMEEGTRKADSEGSKRQRQARNREGVTTASQSEARNREGVTTASQSEEELDDEGGYTVGKQSEGEKTGGEAVTMDSKVLGRGHSLDSRAGGGTSLDGSTADPANTTRNKSLRVMEGVCGPGDVLFVPSGWWHMALNLDECVAVTQNFCSPRTLPAVLRFLAAAEGRGSEVCTDP